MLDQWETEAPEALTSPPTHLGRQAVLLLTDFIDDIEDAEEQRAAAGSADPVTLAAAAGGVGVAPAQAVGDGRVAVTITLGQPAAGGTAAEDALQTVVPPSGGDVVDDDYEDYEI